MSDSTADLGPGNSTAKRSFGASPRWVKAALFGSLAVNLLVVGLSTGAMWHLRTGPMVGGGNLHGNIMAFSQTLSAARRMELDALIGDKRPQLEQQTQRQDLRIARREVMRLFRADPFNITSFQAAEARVAAAEARLRESADLRAANLANQLTAAERAAFLKWREARRGRWWSESERAAKGAPQKAP
jgi:Spy/CpxP family protein refolding chaperone